MSDPSTNDRRRDVLEPYLDRQVVVRGAYDKSTNHKTSTGWRRTALVQDCVVEVDGVRLDVGHAWIQHAAAVERVAGPLQAGDRLEFKARVMRYKKRLPVSGGRADLMVDVCYGLAHPTDIVVTAREPRSLYDTGGPPPAPTVPSTVATPPPPVPTPVSPPPTPATPVDPLAQLMQVRRWAEEVGGLDRLAELVRILKQLSTPGGTP